MSFVGGVCKLGSSPRVRGAADRLERQSTSLGIIPARAGSSGVRMMFARLHRDHPRACGEQKRGNLYSMVDAGSSPRVRGAVCSLIVCVLHIGIIPARAGSRGVCWDCNTGNRDHPRACGEQPVQDGSTVQALGSSPRVRGAALASNGGRAQYGIIPARAGSRLHTPPSTTARRDHPRACGEQKLTTPRRARLSGSSPRVRGAVCCFPGSATR